MFTCFFLVKSWFSKQVGPWMIWALLLALGVEGSGPLCPHCLSWTEIWVFKFPLLCVCECVNAICATPITEKVVVERNITWRTRSSTLWYHVWVQSVLFPPVFGTVPLTGSALQSFAHLMLIWRWCLNAFWSVRACFHTLSSCLQVSMGAWAACSGGGIPAQGRGGGAGSSLKSLPIQTTQWSWDWGMTFGTAVQWKSFWGFSKPQCPFATCSGMTADAVGKMWSSPGDCAAPTALKASRFVLFDFRQTV